MTLHLYYVVRGSEAAGYTLVSGPFSSLDQALDAKSGQLFSEGMTVVKHTIEVTNERTNF